ncbi:uncharacterized protein LOC111074069 [Drosophila obscura]|uniref:uncharacterized protein LOC111074069 n=1 Tax=Drosophila obscura TaxID=7282 RepID=UPI001BB0DCAA|nr:uncharacterized protein LOC111074069 [Drosophila obscura]
MASKSELNDRSYCLLSLSWMLSHQPRLEGGNNEYYRGQHWSHRSPQFQQQVEQEPGCVTCPFYTNASDLGLGPALAKLPPHNAYAMDNNRIRSTEPNNQQPCSCYPCTATIEDDPRVDAPPPTETAPTGHMENSEEYNWIEGSEPMEQQSPAEKDATGRKSQDNDAKGKSHYMEYRQFKGTSKTKPSREIKSGTGIRRRDGNDPLYFDPLNYRSTSKKRKRKVVKISVPAATPVQKCQCTKAAIPTPTTKRNTPEHKKGYVCSDRCPRCRSRSRSRDNRSPPPVAVRTKARSRRPFAVRSQRSVAASGKSAGKSACSCSTSKGNPSKRRPTDYIATKPIKKILKRNPLAVCQASSQMDDILPHEEYFEKYEQNWTNRHKHKRSARCGGGIHGRNPLAVCRPCSEQLEEYTDNNGYPDETRARKFQYQASDETMMEWQENIHHYGYPENGTEAHSSWSNKERTTKTCPVCDQLGCAPPKPKRACIRLVCRVQPKRPTAGSAAYGKLVILPNAQTKKPTTIYRSLGPPYPIRRVRRSRKSSHFPAVPQPCLLRICYETPGPRTRTLRCKGGRNESAGVPRNRSRTRTRPTTVAEAPYMLPQRHQHSTSVPRQTLAPERREPSAHRQSNQGRSGAASPSRLPQSQPKALRFPQQPLVQAQPQAQPLAQPQAQLQSQPQPQARYSQQPQAQAHRAQQQRQYASPNHLESRVLPTSVNQSFPGFVRPIPVDPRSELARTFPPSTPIPSKPQRLTSQPAKEKPLSSWPQNPEATYTRPPNQARSPNRPQHPEAAYSRQQDDDRAASNPQNQGAALMWPPANVNRAASKPQYQEAGPRRTQNEDQATARPQHREPAAPPSPQNEDRRDSRPPPHHEAILPRTQNPRAAQRPQSMQPSTRAPAEEAVPVPENRGPAAFYRGSFLTVRESLEHLNESSRGPVYRREPISHLRANTRRGLVLNPDSESLLATTRWPGMLQSYQGYIFGGPNIKSPGGWSWRRLFGSYMKKWKSKT